MTILTSLLMALVSCSPEEGIQIDVIDPQVIDFVNVVIDDDLIEAFGEENIHFGHTPPSLEGLSFYVQGMDYVVCKRYIFDVYNNYQPTLSHADPPSYDGSRNWHHFYHHIENMAGHKMKTIDTYNDTYIREMDTVFILGVSESHCFTAYYEEEIKEEGSGNPVHGILISGKLVYDGNGELLGVMDYRIGKKILEYRGTPPYGSAYAQGTIEVKEHRELAPIILWDR